MFTYNSREEAHRDSSTIEQQQWTLGTLKFSTRECFRTTRFLIITFISEYKNDSNTFVLKAKNSV